MTEETHSDGIATARISTKKWISPVWILPIVALLLGISLLIKGILDRGVIITLEVPTSEGMEVGKTKVLYKGINVGVVKAINGTEDLNSVILTIEMLKRAEPYLTDKTLFWVVKPQISLAGVTGLQTILSGHYIDIRPSDKGRKSRRFVALKEPPPPLQTTPGLHINLRLDKLASVSKGTQITYKQIPIGKVTNYTLENDDKEIHASVLIEPEFAHLVTQQSRFYNVSGIKVDAGLAGIHIETESLVSIMIGGIALYTPQSEKPATAAVNGDIFTLYDDLETAKADLPESMPGLHIQLETETLGSLSAGDPIYYRQIPVGNLQSYRLAENDKNIIFDVLIKPEFAHLVRKNTRFYNVSGINIKGGLSGVSIKTETLASILSGGIAFYTPESEAKQTSSENNQRFKLYTDFEDARAGLELKIDFDTAEGLVEGSTNLIYKGLMLGTVKKIHINQEKKNVTAQLLIDPIAEPLLREETRFWMVSPKISLSSVEHLDTLITGSYITLRPGKGKVKNHFQILPEEPALDASTPGLHLKIKSDELGSVDTGSPVMYQRIQIGSVQGYELSSDRRNVLISIHIWPEYQDLISPRSRFYNASGMDFKVTLSEVSVRTESLMSILKGGIALYNDPALKVSEKVENFTVYSLFEDYDTAKMNAFNVSVQFDQLNGLQQGSAVKYQGIKVGKVKKITLQHNSGKILVLLSLDGKLKNSLGQQSKFWIITPKLGISRTENLDTLIAGNYIQVEPKKGKFKAHFIGMEDRPLIRDTRDYNISLTASRLGSINVGDPVYYRQIKVGQVVGFELAETADQILIHLGIRQRYRPLVRENSRFWHASGLSADINLFGKSKIRTESLESIMSGGISFATPDNHQMGKILPENSYFILHEEPQSGWLNWNPIIQLTKETLQE